MYADILFALCDELDELLKRPPGVETNALYPTHDTVEQDHEFMAQREERAVYARESRDDHQELRKARQ